MQDQSLSLSTQKHPSNAHEMKRSCRKYPAPFLNFEKFWYWQNYFCKRKIGCCFAFVLTNMAPAQSIIFKPAWLCCLCWTLLSFVGQHEHNPFEQCFGRWTPLERSYDVLNLYISLKAVYFSEQLIFSSLEIPDDCWVFQYKTVKTIFSSSPWRENSPYPLPMWHVYKYNLLSLLEAIQIMGFILHPTQMAATESGQEGRRLERKHMKLYRQDLKGKDR